MEAQVRQCQNCKKDFTIESEDFNFYEKIKVPPPTFCFDCRLKRKASYLNPRTLFRSICEKCSKNIISMYPPESTYQVFCNDCWFEERGGWIEYGKDYDFSRNFFEQFFDMYNKIPAMNLKQNPTNKNARYSNFTYNNTNVYLSYMVRKSEDIFYSKQVFPGNKACLDSEVIHENERGYELVFSSRNYDSRFLVRSNECVESGFLFDCSNCINCFMSSSLRNKSYVFRNQQLTRDKYLKEMENLSLDSYLMQEELKKEFFDLCEKAIYRFAVIKNSDSCTGDFIENSKNAKYSFNLESTENSKYLIFGSNTIHDSYDALCIGDNQSSYEITDCGGGSNKIMFCFGVSTCHELTYCAMSKNIRNCFGCVGLENKQYCILNKQYSKEEYEALLPKIINHMNEMPYTDKKGNIYKYGEFFPMEFSPFPYNESLAYEEFLMTKEEAEMEGYVWREREKKEYKPTIKSNELPDRLTDTEDSILNEAIACPNMGHMDTQCTVAYRIMPDELRFYRLMKIPLPRFCPNCRYYERKKWKNPYKLWRRGCMCDKDSHSHGKEKCKIEFETSYAPDRTEIVCCEKCYQQEVY